ncbi:hypothetical protein SK854_25365 [Lentzea sp. BCCO 10_0061]|uniref:Uncharacterized protein n=1 Tax=Lentzea sokolovensis TaxID=3095429 RepID=A0ABU4V193_9PSEU|nr:hypothetical protein [Lentzea sp. BCCO 10_0061]MDX8145464.1 hypothetical protein [Lentzea sp. BCCO 10_0061]
MDEVEPFERALAALTRETGCVVDLEAEHGLREVGNAAFRSSDQVCVTLAHEPDTALS